MYVHTFGAFFGMSATHWFWMQKNKKEEKKDASAFLASHNSKLLAMAGTLFLWMFWPSFNGALGSGLNQHRVICNTVLAMIGSCISSFITARILTGKLEMDAILNATLAGGVGVGTSSDMVGNPGIALLIGIGAGMISAISLNRIGPMLEEKLGLHDTCGAYSLHGLPGVYGALVGVIVASTTHTYMNEEALANQFAYTAEGRTTSY